MRQTRLIVFPKTSSSRQPSRRSEYLVSFSSFMDETAQQADLILPNQMGLERLDDAVGLPGVPYAYYAVASPILKPAVGTKHTGDVLLALGRSLGGDVSAGLPWSDYQTYLQKRVRGAGGIAKGRGGRPRRDGALEATTRRCGGDEL